MASLYDLPPVNLLPALQTAFSQYSCHTMASLINNLNGRALMTGPNAKENISTFLSILGSTVKDFPITQEFKLAAEQYFGPDVSNGYYKSVGVVNNATANVQVHIHNNNPVPLTASPIITTPVDSKGKPTIVPGANKSNLVDPITVIDGNTCFVFAIPKMKDFDIGTKFTAEITVVGSFVRGKKEANILFESDLVALKELNPKANDSDVPHGYMVAKFGDYIGGEPPEIKDRSIKPKNKVDS